MSLNRERKHAYGSSNIDFRTKRDAEAIKTYQPWLLGKQFGTMGNQGYAMTKYEKESIFRPIKSLSNHKDLVNEVPNPKYHKTCEYYFKNKLKHHKEDYKLASPRARNLDESFKGKEKFTGDSLMISVNTKKKRKIDKSLNHEDRQKFSEHP